MRASKAQLQKQPALAARAMNEETNLTLKTVGGRGGRGARAGGEIKEKKKTKKLSTDLAMLLSRSPAARPGQQQHQRAERRRRALRKLR